MDLEDTAPVSVCGFRRCLTVPLQDILDGFGRCRIWFYEMLWRRG